MGTVMQGPIPLSQSGYFHHFSPWLIPAHRAAPEPGAAAEPGKGLEHQSDEEQLRDCLAGTKLGVRVGAA